MNTVIIDNGHGIETPGKRSPDGKVREYAVTRHIAHGVAELLRERGYRVIILVPYDADMALAKRAEKVNRIYAEHPESVLLSIHCNAAGNGEEWCDATGIEAYTTVGNTKADRLAECFYEALDELLPEARQRIDLSDGDRDKERDYYILKKTKCPAVLTENYFMDNPAEARILLSSEGLRKLVDVHVLAIVKYYNNEAGK